MTNDADFVVELANDNRVSAVAADLLPDLILDPQMRLETITGNLRYVVSHRQSPFKVELFLLTSDPHHQVRFQRRQLHRLDGREVYFQTAEDVVIQKLKWYARARRDKDLNDVVDVIDAQRSRLDMDYIRHWCGEHGTSDWLAHAMAAADAP